MTFGLDPGEKWPLKGTLSYLDLLLHLEWIENNLDNSYVHILGLMAIFYYTNFKHGLLQLYVAAKIVGPTSDFIHY